MGRGQNININSSLEEVDQSLRDDFARPVEAVTADRVEFSWELKLQVEPTLHRLEPTLHSGPVANTPCSQSRGPTFDPFSGS